MTEAEWLAIRDPEQIFKSLRDSASDRKLRLFACACFSRTCPWLKEDGRAIVELGEQHADGVLGERKAEEGRLRALRLGAQQSVSFVLSRNLKSGMIPVMAHEFWMHRDTWKEHCSLLRDIFANPFHPVTLDPAIRLWNSGTVVALAQAIYDDRAFDRLPILADALEDAGCHNADILEHCRGPGPHVRGCWVVDLVLEKE